MNPLLRFAREIAGLFFDDGSLAIAVLVVLGLTATLVVTTSLDGPVAALFLVGGTVAALVENVVRTARSTLPRGG
jgi:hypothetical protein